MSADVNDELFPEDEQAEAETPEQEQPEDEQAEQAEAEEGDEVKGEDEGAPPAPVKEDGDRVPVGALKDERSKRQALERELAEIRQWRQQLEAQARERQLQSIEDPDERFQAASQQWRQSATAQKLELSRRYAERQHGAELVNEVVEYFNDPARAPMSHQFLQAEDPFGAAVDYYNAQKALSEIGPDPKSYRERLREELRAELMAEISPAKPKTPPPSMAAAPSSGGKSPPIGTGFDALFEG